MPKVIVLGSACAVPDETHENTHLALPGPEPDSGFIQVDCAGRPVVRLRQAGLDFHRLTDLILTHWHPDHAYGAPMLLMDMWLRGRQNPLTVNALPDTAGYMKHLMVAFGCEQWPGLFPITYHEVEARPGAPVLEN